MNNKLSIADKFKFWPVKGEMKDYRLNMYVGRVVDVAFKQGVMRNLIIDKFNIDNITFHIIDSKESIQFEWSQILYLEIVLPEEKNRRMEENDRFFIYRLSSLMTNDKPLIIIQFAVGKSKDTIRFYSFVVLHGDVMNRAMEGFHKNIEYSFSSFHDLQVLSNMEKKEVGEYGWIDLD